MRVQNLSNLRGIMKSGEQPLRPYETALETICKKEINT